MAISAAEQLEQRIIAGDTRALARAATFVEAQAGTGRELLAALFPRTGRAVIVGITGPPGAGKSSLVDQLAKAIRRSGQTAGIIAVDPSSPFSRGAILGDRIRMQDHHNDPGVFIRSMGTRGHLGGLATSTWEMTMLLDAAGRDVVLVETVGVGQDEVDVAGLADVTVLVLAPGFGDDVQAMKAGIMEIADLFAINKADQPGADRLEQEIRAMQSVGTDRDAAHAAPVRRVVATQNIGVEELLSVIRAIFETRGHTSLQSKTWGRRLREMLRDELLSMVPETELEQHARRVASRMENPYTAVAQLRLQLLAPQRP